MPSDRTKLISEQSLIKSIQFISRQLFTVTAARLILAILFIAFAAAAFYKPGYDWDALAYMALAVEPDFATPADLHQFIYDSVKATIPPDGWQLLAHFDAYREAQLTSADNFNSMLGFYRMKMAYIAMVAVAAKFTGIVYAPWLISAGFGLGCLVLFYIFVFKLGMERYFVLTIPLLLASDLPWLIRLPTPDAMSCFFLLLGSYLYIFQNRPSGYAAWFLAIVTRPDNLVFLIALLIVQTIRRDIKAWEYACIALGTLCYFWATGQGSDRGQSAHLGWWAHFYFTNIEYSTNMNDFTVPFSFKTYLGTVLNSTVQMIYKASWFHMYLATLFAYAWTKMRASSTSDIWDGFIIITILAIGARLIVFPFMSGRLLAPMALLAGLALLAKLKDRWHGNEKLLIS